LQADEERFEDDPEEFIVRDIQGEDSESRRRNSQDLLRAMCRQFEPETTRICSEHITAMLAEYVADPVNSAYVFYNIHCWVHKRKPCFSHRVFLLS
jgi:exportin-2 (importin alpha re-exporter)